MSMWEKLFGKLMREANVAYQEGQVRTLSGTYVSEGVAKRLIGVLVDISEDPEKKSVFFPILANAKIGTLFPAELTSLFEGIYPNHNFFDNGKMNEFAQDFFEGMFFPIQNDEYELYTDHYEVQLFRLIEDRRKGKNIKDSVPIDNRRTSGGQKDRARVF